MFYTKRAQLCPEKASLIFLYKQLVNKSILWTVLTVCNKMWTRAPASSWCQTLTPTIGQMAEFSSTNETQQSKLISNQSDGNATLKQPQCKSDVQIQAQSGHFKQDLVCEFAHFAVWSHFGSILWRATWLHKNVLVYVSWLLSPAKKQRPAKCKLTHGTKTKKNTVWRGKWNILSGESLDN